jgi:hypothetical protein
LLLLFEYIVCPLLLSTIWCRGASMMLLREHGSSSARRGKRKGGKERKERGYICVSAAKISGLYGTPARWGLYLHWIGSKYRMV